MPDADYRDVVKVRDHFCAIAAQGLRNRKHAQTAVRRLAALSGVATNQYYAGYLIGLAELIVWTHRVGGGLHAADVASLEKRYAKVREQTDLETNVALERAHQ